MKHVVNMFGKALLACLLLLTGLQELTAQINIQVRVVPPYQSRINEYLTRPELMLLTVVNTSSSTHQLQLTASLKGDNGVSAWLRPGYKSPSPMTVAPGQALNLNALDIAFFFDPQSVEYTGISRSDVTRGMGLLEGTYQFCIQALDYETMEALSPAEPMGCTYFTISSVEPPRILSPLHEQELSYTGAQPVFPITWSTPPGSSPLTEYRVRMVEMVAKRDPNDAMQTAISPVFFDEIVHTNTLLYGPAHPQLTPGREYALMIQAIDPYQTISFRNDGKSEVISFIYADEPTSLISDGSEDTDRVIEDVAMSEGATNAVAGRLLWAFKVDEDQYQYRPVTTSPLIPLELPSSAYQTLAQHYVGHSPLQVMSAPALGQQDPTLQVYTMLPYIPTFTEMYPQATGVWSIPADQLISANTASSLQYSYEPTRAELSSATKPLNGATILIRGEHAVKGASTDNGGNTAVLSVNSPGESARTSQSSRSITREGRGQTVPVIGGKAKSNTEQDRVNTGIRTSANLPGFSLAGQASKSPGVTTIDRSTDPEPASTPTSPEDEMLGSNELVTTLLASGESDADGYFSLNFLHPEYEGKNPYSRLVISVQHDGFEPFEKEIPIDALDQPDLVQLGELILMAKNYRMHVEVEGANDHTDRMVNYDTKVTWLRKASEVASNPHFIHEGNIAPEEKREMVLDGVRYTTISEQQISAGQQTLDKMTFGTGRLFYQGEVTLHIENGSSAFENHRTSIRVNEPQITKEQTMLTTATYELDLTKPGLGGEVMLRAGTQLNPIPNAVVHVEYNKEDVIHEPVNPIFSGSTASQFAQFAGDYHFPEINTHGVQATGLPLLFDGNQFNPVLPPPGIPGHTSGGYKPPVNSTAVIVTTTDSLGRYYVNDLPMLKEGTSFTVRLATVPQSYQKLPVEPEEKSFQFLGEGGSTTLKDFYIIAEAYAIMGKVVNEQDQNIPFARLNFKGSSTYFESDESGQFYTTYHKGVHTIQVSKDGYLAYEMEVEIGKEGSTFVSLPAYIFPSIPHSDLIVGDQTPSSFTIPPAVAGIFNDLTNDAQVSMQTEDLGSIGPMIRRMGKVEFVVMDKESGTPLPQVQIHLLDTTHVTNEQGIWLYEGYGGTTTVTFRPSEESPYYAIERSIVIEEDGEVTRAEIWMEKGVRVSGKISSGPNPLSEANISLEGSHLHHAISDDMGQYTIYLPPGEQNLRAAKTGYFSKTENRILDQGEDLVLDFHLDSGDGKNISQLLGFDIELDKAVADSTGEKWSGKFVNLRPGSEFFAGDQTYELPFANIKVTFDALGNAIPENNTVETDAKSLKLKLFQYLPVLLIDHEDKKNKIKVTQNELGIGSIRGGLLFDFKEITGRRRFKFDPADSLFVGLQSHIAMEDRGIEFFRSESGSVGTEIAFRLLKAQKDTTTLELFGFAFSIDLTQTRITNMGLEMVGQVKTPQLGPVDSASFEVKTLKINPNFDVTDLLIETGDFSKIGIDRLYAEVTGVSLNEDGFKLAGSIHTDFELTIPSKIDFTDLRFSPESLFGGKFVLPETGIDIYKMAKFTTGMDPLSLGRIAQTEIYTLAGNGLLELERVVKQKIKLDNFMVRSDGRFNLVAEREYKASVGFADINIHSIGLAYEDVPSLSLNGKINVNIPMVELEASNIRFYPTPTGLIRLEADTIHGRVNAPVVDIGVKLSILENGLAGSGALNIPGTDIRAGVGFHFNKINNGIDMGADFQVGASIVLGVAEISNLGGGFTYSTSSGKFSGTIQGNVAVTGLSAAVSLSPAKLTVTDGPVIAGTADIMVADKFETAKASVTLDFREKHFAITVDAKLSPIEGVVESTIKGLMRIKWVPEDTYLFMGVQTHVKLASLLEANGRYVLAVNVKNPKTRNDDLKEWFTHLDDHSYGGSNKTVFSGILLHAFKEVGIPKERAKGIDLIIASGKAWFHARSEVLLIFNFAEHDYLMQMKGHLSAGGEACLVGFCLGAEFTACFNFAGGYNASRGWFLNGNAAGNFAVQVGCRARCNRWGWKDLWVMEIPCGGRMCADAHISFNVSTRGGNNTFSIHSGWNSNGNLCIQ